jgi:hypothetical protein
MTIRTPHKLLLSALIAGTFAVASAQTPPPAAANHHAASDASARPAQRGPRGPMMNPAEMEKRMAERHAEHQAKLKAELKITPEQETAWATFSAAMQPPKMSEMQRPDRAEMDKLTTPQRIDRMEQMQQQRMAEMKKRGDAIKAFYAQLTPYQQGVFDAKAMHHERGMGPGMKGRGGPGGRGEHGHHGGPQQGMGMGMGPGMGDGPR